MNHNNFKQAHPLIGRLFCSTLFGSFIALFVGGCTSRYTMETARLTKLKPDGYTFYILDEANPKTNDWRATDVTIVDSVFIANVKKMPATESARIFKERNNLRCRERILVKIDSKMAATMPDSAHMEIRFSEIQKVRVHESNGAQTPIILLGTGAAFIEAMFVAFVVLYGGD